MLLLETGRDSLFLFTLKLHWVFLSHTLQLADNRFSKIMFTIGVVNEHKWLRVIKENAIAYGNWDKFINFLDFSRVDPALAELYNHMIIKDREGLMDKVILGQFHPHYKEIKLGWGREEFLGLGLSLQEMRFILLARLEMLPLVSFGNHGLLKMIINVQFVILKKMKMLCILFLNALCIKSLELKFLGWKKLIWQFWIF